MRTIAVTFLAVLITATMAAIFIFGSTYSATSGLIGVARIPGVLYGAVYTFFKPSGARTMEEYVISAGAILEESQELRSDRDRYRLIDNISRYTHEMSGALAYAEKILSNDDEIAEDDRVDTLERAVRVTARHLFSWSSLYYYLHPEAQNVLRPTIGMLEDEHKKMLKALTEVDPARGGALATEDIEYYIEDIRKSAARRNSDFIRFSYEDYIGYREFFDGLGNRRQEFLFGFGDRAYILFDDLYAMHEEVDSAYSDKTRAYVGDMRLEIREMHKKILSELYAVDYDRALKAVEEVLSAISKEKERYGEWRKEVRDAMEADVVFYKALRKEMKQSFQAQ